jgi:hypothetical protein
MSSLDVMRDGPYRYAAFLQSTHMITLPLSVRRNYLRHHAFRQNKNQPPEPKVGGGKSLRSVLVFLESAIYY